MPSEPHECDRIEKASFETYGPYVRKKRSENRRKSSEDRRGDELDLDERRGYETGNDGSDLLQVAWATYIQEPGVREQDVRALGKDLEEGG